MPVRTSRVASFAAAAALVTVGVVACSAGKDRAGFVVDGAPTEPGNTKGDGGADDMPAFGGDGSVPTDCTGLACKQVKCEDEGTTTTLSGAVYDPAGHTPLYNVMVYIPSGEGTEDLPPIPQGAQCETCASVVLNPLVSALTNEAGEFTLENVPVGTDVPVVVQVGKWRRRFNLDITKTCAENKTPGKTFRLPRSGDEGDMPQIAVTTGGQDSLECLLRGIGIDEAEFVAGDDPSGHVHVFNGYGGKFSGAPTAEAELWNDVEKLKKYDMALFSCEGNVHPENKGGTETGARGAVAEYLDAGGRVFATHYHYTWFQDSPSADIQSIASFHDSYDATNGLHDVNTSFPKGQALATWLEGVTGSPAGKVDLENMRDSVMTISDKAVAWITSPQDDDKPRYFSFNTPVNAAPAAQCGRAVFSDLHITSSAGPTAIDKCSIHSGSLNDQQRALEFFFFDLSGCVQDDKVPPTVPH